MREFLKAHGGMAVIAAAIVLTTLIGAISGGPDSGCRMKVGCSDCEHGVIDGGAP